MAKEQNETLEDHLKKWDFNWPVMQVLIGGRSAVDLTALRIKDEREAQEFILRYGFDPNYALDRRKMHSVIVEALSFIERYLIPQKWKQGLKPPEEILHCNDVVELLLKASPIVNKNKLSRAWACSVLRLMHTIAHIEGTDRLVDIDSARRQILIKFHESVWTADDGRIYLGYGDEKLELSHIEYKKSKSRQSIILKLLHKPANVAETIYDLLGVRIVTKKLTDVMLVVKYLRDQYLVTFANCNPTRARNSLIDTEQFRNNIDLLKSMVDQKKLAASEFEKLLESMTTPIARYKVNSSNPHSSAQYRAIQLTCRQLVRMSNPTGSWSHKIETAIGTGKLESSQTIASLKEIVHFTKEWQGERFDEVSTFFPFEVQIMDEDSYKKSRTGDAAHDRYKQLQVRTAKRRVLNEVLKLEKSV